jgi:hypothetical protein
MTITQTDAVRHPRVYLAGTASVFILLFDNRTRVLYNTVRLRNLPSSFKMSTHPAGSDRLPVPGG